MPPALRRAAPGLTPALALDYVRELSADVRAGVVLDGAGALLAGPRELATAARAVIEASGDAAELVAATADGVVCAARTADYAMVVVCGRFAIAAVVRGDMRAALAAVESRAPTPAAVDDSEVESRPPPRQPAAVDDSEVESRPPPPPPKPAAVDDRALESRVAAAAVGDRDVDEPLARAAGALISAAQRGFGA